MFRSRVLAPLLGLLAGLPLATPGLPAPAPASAAAGPLPGWQWPLRPAPDRVVRAFDPPAEPWLPGHRGVDLAARPGQPVHAAGAGVVTFAGAVARVGVVSVMSGALRTTYEPVRATVRAGQPVAAGQVVGRLTARGSHCAPDTCLHWGLLREEDGVWAYLDPLALLGREQVRLLPFSATASSP